MEVRRHAAPPTKCAVPRRVVSLSQNWFPSPCRPFISKPIFKIFAPCHIIRRRGSQRGCSLLYDTHTYNIKLWDIVDTMAMVNKILWEFNSTNNRAHRCKLSKTNQSTEYRPRMKRKRIKWFDIMLVRCVYKKKFNNKCLNRYIDTCSIAHAKFNVTEIRCEVYIAQQIDVLVHRSNSIQRQSHIMPLIFHTNSTWVQSTYIACVFQWKMYYNFPANVFILYRHRCYKQ